MCCGPRNIRLMKPNHIFTRVDLSQQFNIFYLILYALLSEIPQWPDNWCLLFGEKENAPTKNEPRQLFFPLVDQNQQRPLLTIGALAMYQYNLQKKSYRN